MFSSVNLRDETAVASDHSLAPASRKNATVLTLSPRAGSSWNRIAYLLSGDYWMASRARRRPIRAGAIV
jgi:hypothetical protein